MVSATIAEATRYGVNIKRQPSGEVVDVRSADLVDQDDPHGINRDEADWLAEEMGWLVGTWRWQEAGFYKAVCTPKSQRKKRDPYYTEEEMAAHRREDAARKLRRAELVRTGKVKPIKGIDF